MEGEVEVDKGGKLWVAGLPGYREKDQMISCVSTVEIHDRRLAWQPMTVMMLMIELQIKGECPYHYPTTNTAGGCLMNHNANLAR